MRRLVLVSPFLMWALVAAGALLCFRLTGYSWVFTRRAITSWLLLPAWIYWAYFLFSAVRTNREAHHSAAGVKRLVTEGLYRRVRHPIYSAYIVLAWGIFLFLPRVDVLLSVIWLTLVLFGWACLEERAMIARFGDDYVAYKKRTPMLVPKIRTTDG